MRSNKKNPWCLPHAMKAVRSVLAEPLILQDEICMLLFLVSIVDFCPSPEIF